MSNFVLLNNVDHKNLKVIREYNPKFGDNEMYAVTFPQEFRSIQAHYPILFKKDYETGGFFPVALFGLRRDENLFLTEKGWDAEYIPLSVKRKPFLIGIQSDSESKMMVYLDTKSPRLSDLEGEPVFMPHGGYSDYLNDIVSTLDYIYVGTETNKLYMDSLVKHDLIETITFDIELKNGSKNQLSGFYTINEEKLKLLDQVALKELHHQGFIEYIYMALASLSRVPDLIARIEAKV